MTSLVCALLHDVVEDTDDSLSEIEQRFGKKIAFFVDGLIKFENGIFEKEEYSAINEEKLLSTAIMDIHVAVIILLDRLHNMRALAIKGEERHDEITQSFYENGIFYNLPETDMQKFKRKTFRKLYLLCKVYCSLILNML